MCNDSLSYKRNLYYNSFGFVISRQDAFTFYYQRNQPHAIIENFHTGSNDNSN